MKVALIPGHGPVYDQGAENANGVTELDWNRSLVSRIVCCLDPSVDYVVIHRTAEKTSPVPEINASKADFALEFHCNAYDGLASGTEMVCVSKQGRLIASLLQSHAVSVLGLPDRGIKPPFARRGNYFLTRTTMPAVIVESFFIDNTNDLRTATERKEALAGGYAQAILDCTHFLT